MAKANQGRKYAIDTHPQKKAIIEAILKGESFRGIALKYGSREHSLSDMSVARYVNEVLAKDMAVCIAASKQSDLSTIDGCVKELEGIAEVCKRMIKQAEDDLNELDDFKLRVAFRKDIHNYLRAYLNELRQTVESIGRFLGMVKDTTVINNINLADSRYLAKLTEIISEELKDYPELKQRVVKRLADE